MRALITDNHFIFMNFYSKQICNAFTLLIILIEYDMDTCVDFR